jgi:hypothetical protein
MHAQPRPAGRILLGGLRWPNMPARDPHGHLVETAPRRWSRSSAAKFLGEYRPELRTRRRTVPQETSSHAPRAGLRRRDS